MTEKEFAGICEKYWKNKEGLHFKAGVKQSPEGIVLKITGIEPRYKAALERLVKQMLNGGMAYASSLCKRSSVKEEHRKDYEERWTGHVSDNLETYLNLLLRYEYTVFVEQLFLALARFELSYFLEHISPINTKDGLIYRGPNEEIFAKKTWQNEPLSFHRIINWENLLVFPA